MSDGEPYRPTGREYPQRPIVGVGGLIFKDRSAILVRRAKDPGRGNWSLPGGAVRTGENLARALAREMDEEVGLQVEVGPLVEVVEFIFPDNDGRVAYHYVVLDYLCRAEDGPPRPGSDVSEALYVPPENWPEYKLPAITLRVLNKGIDMLSAWRV
ncbi:MAG: NUDIX hydrolase [Proteobacteria bacterium]|nr:NUDIX hydrolase [Pseudomonadota bacterium]